jgi:hypothetical protein
MGPAFYGLTKFRFHGVLSLCNPYPWSLPAGYLIIRNSHDSASRLTPDLSRALLRRHPQNQCAGQEAALGIRLQYSIYNGTARSVIELSK